jgi:hypothetical protein
LSSARSTTGPQVSAGGRARSRSGAGQLVVGLVPVRGFPNRLVGLQPAPSAPPTVATDAASQATSRTTVVKVTTLNRTTCSGAVGRDGACFHRSAPMTMVSTTATTDAAAGAALIFAGMVVPTTEDAHNGEAHDEDGTG